MNRDHLLFVDGNWRAGQDGKRLELVDPATETAIGHVAHASAGDIGEALESGHAAGRAWASRPPAERGEILLAAARNLAGRVDTAARELSEEQGKTIAEARGEYARALETLEWCGRNAETLCETVGIDVGRSLVPQPLGLVAAFTPWNYPAVLNARKIAAPLAAGCTVILKAAEEAPSAAGHIIASLEEAGLPAGVVNLLFGDPPEISERLLASPYVKVLTFTGSTRVGKQLAALAAENLQRCVLELGGHSPVIVFADADIEAAITAICENKFECAGQSCNAPSRLILETSVHDAVLERILEQARSIRIGNGSDPGTEMGPMANARRIDAMEALTADAVERGARLLLGGRRLNRPGYFWPPTILTDVPDQARVLTEEPFGPILTVSRFDGIEDALRQANATSYGLAAYVFSGSPDVISAAVAGLDAGAVSVNRFKGVSADAPNGGIGDSGYGYEGGIEGLREFQYLKLVNH